MYTEFFHLDKIITSMVGRDISKMVKLVWQIIDADNLVSRGKCKYIYQKNNDYRRRVPPKPEAVLVPEDVLELPPKLPPPPPPHPLPVPQVEP